MGQCLNNGAPNVVESDDKPKETPKAEGDNKVYGDHGDKEEKKEDDQTKKTAKPEQDAADTTADAKAPDETPKETTKKEPEPEPEPEPEAKPEPEPEPEPEPKETKKESEKSSAPPKEESKEKLTQETQSTVIIGGNVKIGNNVKIGTSGNTTVLINHKPVNALTDVEKEARAGGVQIGSTAVIAKSSEVASRLPPKEEAKPIPSSHVSCVDHSATYGGYPIENMFSESSDYWCSEDAKDVFLVFDVQSANLSVWQMTMGYDCGVVTFSTASDKDGSYQEIASGKPSQEIDLQNKNKRYIKLEFSEVDSGYVGITELKITGTGSTPPADEAEKKEEESRKYGDGMADENEDAFEADEAAVDVSSNPNIKCIESYPKSDDFKNKVKKMYTDSPYEFMDLYEYENDKDVWLKFDVGSMKLDTLEVNVWETYHAKVIMVYTSDTSDDADFKLIKIKRNLQKKEKKTFYLKSQHSRYIKIAFQARVNNGFVGINRMKWSGFQLKQDLQGLIPSNGIRIYQCSGKKEDAGSVFKTNSECWKAETGETAWIIFDCMRYEVHKIVITFKDQCVPEIVKLKLSDVAPRYAFEIPSAKKFTLNTTQSYKAEDWSDIELTHELTVSPAVYEAAGFKRYIMLEFGKYMIDTIEIQRIQFFGATSSKINADDEQFQERFDGDGTESEEKTDDAAPYKPDFVDSSAGMQGMPLENIWKEEDHFFWMGQYGVDPFLILDLGNNEANLREILIKAYPSYIYKTLKMSTSDKAKSKNWDLLIQDDEMESKMQDGGRYDMTQWTVKKYVKLEFFELKMQMFALSQLKLYGEGEFLVGEEKKLTLDDIKNMPYNDSDLIERFKNQMIKESTAKLTHLASQVSMIEQDPNKGKLCDEWKTLKLEYYESMNSMLYQFTPVFAYGSDTLYEQELMFQIYEKQKQIAHQCCTEQVENEMKYAEKEKELKENEKTAEKEWRASLEDTDVPQKRKLELQKIYTTNQKIASEAMTEYYAQFTKHQQGWHDKIYKLFQNPKAQLVYETWKDAVINTPSQLSSNFTVHDYQNALDQYATRNDKEGLSKMYGILADLFDKSMKEKKEYLAKFFVYQLNHSYNYQTYARSASYGIAPVTIVFDVGSDLDGKIAHIDFKCSQIGTNSIVVSTADTLMEEKADSPDADDDEMVYNYRNFEVIQKLEFSEEIRKRKGDRDAGGVGYEDTRVQLEYRNRRYVKVDFTDWDEKSNYCALTIERVKVFAKDEAKESIDEDMKDGGEQIDKYKLKMVKDNKAQGSRRDIDAAYKLDTYSYYETQNSEKNPFLIFDCETRKIDTFEIGFDDTSWRRFDKYVISTTSAEEYDTAGDDEWKVIFEEEGNFDSYIFKDGASPKTIALNGANERFIRFAFELSEESNQLEIVRLKFNTTDPAEQYKWDFDEGIKNLTSKIKIVTANKAMRGQQAENMLSDAYGQGYMTSVNGKNHKEQIEDKIRDEVCRGVNLLRKSRGGKISKHDKHYIKFLCCFQNKRNYPEMLYSAKLVMGLLRKPLDIEYKRLQSIDSPILSLKLEAQYKCEDAITSIHQLLEFDYNEWYKPRNAMFWPNDLKPLAEEWSGMGLNVTDPEFKQLRRSSALEPDKSYVTAEDLAMEYLNLIAARLDRSFQREMRALFKENREKLEREYPTGDPDLAVQSGPVKTKARQKIKVDLKYFKKAPPQCMAVLDIVRCGIVCEDDAELCSLYQLIMERFKGNILRVKNAFDDIRKGDDSHGYRAVMININFGDDSVIKKPGIKMVCEAQLLLNKYYQVRKDMHLGYGICRSEDGGISDKTSPYVVLARDCAKFGKLDI